MTFQYPLLMLFASLVGFSINAQVVNDDSIFVERARAYTASTHQKELAENLGLYNGTVYDQRYIGSKGHPYFLSDSLIEGSVYYNGFLYKHVPLLYNLVTDELLIESYDHLHNLQLIKDKIRYFTINNHFFIQINTNLAQEKSIPAGFYEALHHNVLMLLAKREKVFNQVAKGQLLDSRFKSYDEYYVSIDSNYFLITNTSGLLSVFGKHKAELRSYLRKNNLNFKRGPEQTLLKAIMYYEQLTN